MNSSPPNLFPSAAGPRAPILAAMLALLLPMAGCVSVRVHRVGKTIVAPHVLDATLEQLVQSMDARYAAIRTINASVEIKASSGGSHEGEVKEIPTFSGYIFLRKPADLRVLLLLPVLRSRALDMVSDGTTFKLYIPPKDRAITGTDKPVGEPAIQPPSQPAVPSGPGSSVATVNPDAGLQSLRPYIIRDALLIPSVTPDEFYTLTQDSRLLPPEPGRKESIEEPDYNITVLHKLGGQTLERVRVIRIGRIDLQPYEQDIYDRYGRIVTTVLYSKYVKSGDIEFPTHLFIKRPLDEYTLDIELTKLQLNTRFEDEQFALTIPEKTPIQKMP